MSANPLWQIGARLLVAYLKQKQTGPQQVGSVTVQTVSDKDTALLELKNKSGSVSLVVGTRDTGKTVLSRRLAEFLGRPTYAISPQQMTPSWIRRINFTDIWEIVPSMSTIIFDDLPAYASNRDYNEEVVQSVEKLIPMVRHEPHPPEFPLGQLHLIFCTQSAVQADRYILDCDAAFLKPLGMFVEERQNVARAYRNYVNPEFDNKPSDWVKNHAYLMTPTWRGVIQIGMTD